MLKLSDSQYNELLESSFAFRMAEKELDEAYRTLKARLSAEVFTPIKTEQRRWISERCSLAARHVDKGMDEADAFALVSRERAQVPLSYDEKATGGEDADSLRAWMSSAVNRDGLQDGTVAEVVKQAEQGNIAAQCHLGEVHYLGQGVRQDYQQAFLWCTKAAEQGDARGQCNLGVMYERGEGVLQDMQLAVIWVTKAAEQGFVEAQVILGDMYLDGKGVRKNGYTAMEWFGKACENGNEDGCKANAGLNNILPSPEDYSRTNDELLKFKQENERLREEANNRAKRNLDEAMKRATE